MRRFSWVTATARIRSRAVVVDRGRVEQQYVLGVHEADHAVEVAFVDQHAGSARGAYRGGDLGGRLIGSDGDDVPAGGHHRCRIEPGQLEAAREQAVLVGGDVALVGRLLEEQQQIGRRVRHRQLVLRLDASRANEAVGDDVEEPDHRADHERESPERPGQGDGRRFGVRDRPRLGRHLADHHVEEHDDRERDREPDGPQHALRHVDDAREGGFDHVRDRRLGDGAEQQ